MIKIIMSNIVKLLCSYFSPNIEETIQRIPPTINMIDQIPPAEETEVFAVDMASFLGYARVRQDGIHLEKAFEGFFRRSFDIQLSSFSGNLMIILNAKSGIRSYLDGPTTLRKPTITGCVHEYIEDLEILIEIGVKTERVISVSILEYVPKLRGFSDQPIKFDLTKLSLNKPVSPSSMEKPDLNLLIGNLLADIARISMRKLFPGHMFYKPDFTDLLTNNG